MKKANGDGSVYYDNSRKKYCAAFTDPQGKRIRKRFDSSNEAKKWLKEMQADIVRDEYVVPNNTTIIEWVLDYIEIYKKPNVRPSTLERYLILVKMLSPIALLKLQTVKAIQIQKFYRTIDNYSSSVKGHIHFLLFSAFKKAQQLEMINKNIMENVERPTAPKNKIDIYTNSELKEIYAVCSRLPRWKAIFLLALKTGLRKGEILALEIKDVFPTYVDINKTATVVNGKRFVGPPKTATSIRTVPITKDVYEAVMACVGERKQGDVFITKSGLPIHPSMFSKYWHRKLNDAGVPIKHFHALRHTFATKMLAAGTPVANVSKLLGHSDSSITYSVYAHADENTDNKMIEIIEKTFEI